MVRTLRFLLGEGVTALVVAAVVILVVVVVGVVGVVVVVVVEVVVVGRQVLPTVPIMIYSQISISRS